MDMPEFIQELVENGIDVTITNHHKLGLCFDLNTQAKSGVLVFQRDGKWWADMRYDEQFVLNDIQDVRECVLHGMHGRDFINANWGEYLENH